MDYKKVKMFSLPYSHEGVNGYVYGKSGLLLLESKRKFDALLVRVLCAEGDDIPLKADGESGLKYISEDCFRKLVDWLVETGRDVHMKKDIDL